MTKLSIDTLRQSLGDGDWPDIKQLQFSSGVADLQMTVPQALDVFRGHFPGQPVLPGILQIHWAAEIGRLVFTPQHLSLSRLNFSALRGIKFNGMILPNQALNLSLNLNFETSRLRFTFSDSAQKFSNGSIEFSGISG